MPTNPFILPVFRPKLTDMCFCGSGELFGWCCASEEPDRDPPHGVHVVKGFVEPGTCARWVDQLERQSRTRSDLYDHDRSSAASVQTTVGHGRTSEYVDVGGLRAEIDQAVARALRQSEALFGRNVEWFELPRVLRYGPGQHYGVHADNCHRERHENFWTKKADRDVSLLIYLNEDFTGGGLQFEKFRYVYQPKLGDLLLFPSDNRYKHGANPVQAGIRYVIVSWAAFTDEPRIYPKPPGAVIPMSNFASPDEELA